MLSRTGAITILFAALFLTGLCSCTRDGQEYHSLGRETEEIDIEDLARVIPYKLDYVLFDACLMSNVEVLWAMRDVCDYLIASPTEVPKPGFDYTTLAGHLLQPDRPDLLAVCEDFHSLYAPGGKHGDYGACLTLADCRKMEGLAEVCRTLFDRYRTVIRTLDGGNVQAYGSPGKSFQVFFDLKDLIREAGATESELASLQASLDEVVLFEDHTEKTTYSPNLERVCGLSVYLPAYPDHRRDWSKVWICSGTRGILDVLMSYTPFHSEVLNGSMWLISYKALPVY